jgi:hypothetical protein
LDRGRQPMDVNAHMHTRNLNASVYVYVYVKICSRFEEIDQSIYDEDVGPADTTQQRSDSSAATQCMGVDYQWLEPAAVLVSDRRSACQVVGAGSF